MDYSDIRWLNTGAGYHVCIEVEDDDGAWVDLNAQWPEAYPDYTRCLIRMPRVSSQTEDAPGVFVVNSDTLEVDNSPWAGTEVGFWDTDLPVTINRGTPSAITAHVFSSWGGRRLRISLDFYGSNSKYIETVSRGIFLIEEVRTSSGSNASVILGPLTKKLVEKSAEGVKHGSDWYRSMPIGALIHLLAKAADGAFDVDPDLAAGAIDYDVLPSNRASSWGPCPGTLVDGSPSLYHWIPRCFAKAGGSLTAIYVGFEVPNTVEQSSGAIAKFDLTTGKWTIVLLPTDTTMTDRFPIALYVPSTGTIATAFCITDIDPREGIDDPIHFHTVQLVEFYKDQDGNGDPQAGTSRGSSYYYWPARYLLRRGMNVMGPRDWGSAGEQWGIVGYVGNADSGYANKFYGENIPVPFPQAVDTLTGLESDTTSTGMESKWNGYQADDSGLAAASDVVALLPKTGSYSVGIKNLYYTWSLLFRSWVNGAYHGGILAKVSSVYGFYWIATATGFTWQIRTIGALTPWDAAYWGLANLKDASSPTTDLLYRRQITAYAWRTAGTSNRRLYISVIEWNETSQASVPWSRSLLWAADFDGSSGTEATCTKVWEHTPTGTTLAPMIVGLWTPQTSSAEPAQMNDFTIAIIFNRGDMSGSPFGLGILYGPSNYWVTMFADTGVSPTFTYTGPTSSKPFAGFVWNWTDSRLYFIDQATGQLWSVNVSTIDTPVWRLENNALPVHSEHHLATPIGGYLKITSYEYCLWAMAPSMPGESQRPEYGRYAASPILSRYVKGTYPLVQSSRKIADAIEVADFYEMKVWDAIKMLKQKAWNYVLRITSGGQLTMAKRTAGSSVATLVPITSDPYPDVLNGEWPLYSWRTKRIACDQIANDVNVTPYEIKLASEANVERIPPVGSKFAGQVEYALQTERPLRLSMTCVLGGDILSTGKGILWRYARVLETIKVYLAADCASSDTTLLVGAIQERGGRYYAGEHELRIGDGLQILDGSVLTVSLIEVIALNAVRLTFGGTQVGIVAKMWAVVSIVPQDGESASDADAGVTTVVSDDNASTIEVADGSVLAAEMALLIKQERLLVTAISGNILTVTRNQWGSSHSGAHAEGTPIKAYLATLSVNHLYSVGNTGVSIGFVLDPGATDLAARTLLPGDTIRITSEGFRLRPMEHAIIHAVDSTSAGKYGTKEKTIDNNRFVDLVGAEVLDATILSQEKDPKLVVEDGVIPLNPRITGGVTVQIADKKIVPTGTAMDIDVLGASDDYETGSTSLALRSFSAVT